MEPCVVKQVEIGKGTPKICVPIVSLQHHDIINDLLMIKDQDFDLIELRIDFFMGLLDDIELQKLLYEIKELTIKKPIIFTFRSKKEGGNIQISDEQYYRIIELACKSGAVDIIDIEYKSKDVEMLVALVHQHNKIALLSNHNFNATPTKATIEKRLETMQGLQGDILKIAVMPRNPKDVLTLLDATYSCYTRLDKPIVTMSMDGTGVVSRMVGEIFGSAITFAMIGKPSAPGQIDIKKLKKVLSIIHESSK